MEAVAVTVEREREQRQGLPEGITQADYAVMMRNRARIEKVLSEEPDWEGLKEGYRIVEAIRESARAAGVEDMTMEEIDAEIAECRRERRERARQSAK